MNDKLLAELDAAERDAWKNLGRYKFWMFGYFAARWVYLNRLLGAKRPNPFKRLVLTAREIDGRMKRLPLGAASYSPLSGGALFYSRVPICRRGVTAADSGYTRAVARGAPADAPALEDRRNGAANCRVACGSQALALGVPGPSFPRAA